MDKAAVIKWQMAVTEVYNQMIILDAACVPEDAEIPIDTRIRNFEQAVIDCISAFEKYYAENGINHHQRVLELRKMQYSEYLQSPEWQQTRDNHVAGIGFRCQLCGEIKTKSSSLHVHHNTYRRRGNEAPEDLIALCASCHSTFHGKLEVAK